MENGVPYTVAFTAQTSRSKLISGFRTRCRRLDPLDISEHCPDGLQMFVINAPALASIAWKP